MTHTHTFAEWAAMVCIAVSGYSVCSVFYFLLVESESARDFDPRPAVRRVLESGRLDPVLVAVGPAWVAVREAFRDAAALVLLLTTRPTGAMA